MIQIWMVGATENIEVSVERYKIISMAMCISWLKLGGGRGGGVLKCNRPGPLYSPQSNSGSILNPAIPYKWDGQIQVQV